MTKRASSENRSIFQQKYHPENQSRLNRFAMSRFYAALDQMLNQVSGVQSVLDAGCGEAYIMNHFLKPRFEAVVGSDLDFDCIGYVRQTYPQYNVFCSDLTGIPFPDDHFDLVICLEVLEHVGEPQIALDEIYRVSNRYALLSVPNEPFWRIGNMLRGAYLDDWGNTPEHINHWSVWGFRRFVERQFNVLAVATPVTWSMMLLEKRR